MKPGPEAQFRGEFDDALDMPTLSGEAGLVAKQRKLVGKYEGQFKELELMLQCCDVMEWRHRGHFMRAVQQRRCSYLDAQAQLEELEAAQRDFEGNEIAEKEYIKSMRMAKYGMHQGRAGTAVKGAAKDGRTRARESAKRKVKRARTKYAVPRSEMSKSDAFKEFQALAYKWFLDIKLLNDEILATPGDGRRRVELREERNALRGHLWALGFPDQQQVQAAISYQQPPWVLGALEELYYKHLAPFPFSELQQRIKEIGESWDGKLPTRIHDRFTVRLVEDMIVVERG